MLHRFASMELDDKQLLMHVKILETLRDDPMLAPLCIDAMLFLKNEVTHRDDSMLMPIVERDILSRNESILSIPRRTTVVDTVINERAASAATGVSNKQLMLSSLIPVLPVLPQILNYSLPLWFPAACAVAFGFEVQRNMKTTSDIRTAILRSCKDIKWIPYILALLLQIDLKCKLATPRTVEERSSMNMSQSWLQSSFNPEHGDYGRTAVLPIGHMIVFFTHDYILSKEWIATNPTTPELIELFKDYNYTHGGKAKQWTKPSDLHVANMRLKDCGVFRAPNQLDPIKNYMGYSPEASKMHLRNLIDKLDSEANPGNLEYYDFMNRQINLWYSIFAVWSAWRTVCRGGGPMEKFKAVQKEYNDLMPRLSQTDLMSQTDLNGILKTYNRIVQIHIIKNGIYLESLTETMNKLITVLKNLDLNNMFIPEDRVVLEKIEDELNKMATANNMTFKNRPNSSPSRRRR